MSRMAETMKGSTDTTSPDGSTARALSRWERRAAAGGFAFVGIGVIASFLPGAPPASDAPAAKVAAYFHDHAGAIEAQQVIGMLATVGLFWWFGALWRAMNREEGERPLLAVVAAVSLAVGVALATASGAMTSAAAIRIDSLGDGSQLLWTLSLVTVATAGLAFASFVASVCVLNQRARIVPAWTNAVGALAALAFLVGGLGAGTDASIVNVFALIAFLLWCVWIVAVSVFLRRDAAA